MLQPSVWYANGKMNKLDVTFINMEGEERDIFFHYSQLVQEGFKTIDPGQKVEFELVEGDRGLQAHQVVKITE